MILRIFLLLLIYTRIFFFLFLFFLIVHSNIQIKRLSSYLTRSIIHAISFRHNFNHLLLYTSYISRQIRESFTKKHQIYSSIRNSCRGKRIKASARYKYFRKLTFRSNRYLFVCTPRALSRVDVSTRREHRLALDPLPSRLSARVVTRAIYAAPRYVALRRFETMLEYRCGIVFRLNGWFTSGRSVFRCA